MMNGRSSPLDVFIYVFALHWATGDIPLAIQSARDAAECFTAESHDKYVEASRRPGLMAWPYPGCPEADEAEGWAGWYGGYAETGA